MTMSPSEHFLRYGADMQRNPSANFDTKFYLSQYPDAAESGMNPLLHYAKFGRELGYVAHPDEASQTDAVQFESLRKMLLSVGYVDTALADLMTLANEGRCPETRVLAACEVVMALLRERDASNVQAAQALLASSRQLETSVEARRKLLLCEMACHHVAGDRVGAQATMDRGALAGELTPDIYLSFANHHDNPKTKLSWINAALGWSDIAPVDLLPDEALPLFDRLHVPSALDPVTDGPKVTVIVAAFECALVLRTALRSLQSQTWRNLEVIIVDDASQDGGKTIRVAKEFTDKDARFQLLELAENGGAYVARNAGLRKATGDFVTLHDADDWSHPKKIETQMRHMMERPNTVGCTSDQSRAFDDLTFFRLRSGVRMIVFNTSSFLFRRQPVQDRLGCWDTVRFGADSELIRRMQTEFGKRSYVKVPTGPLSFQRDSDTSITSNSFTGLSGAYYGMRLEYFDAQNHHYGTVGPGHLKYDGNPNTRPFPVPPAMRPDRKERLASRPDFDLVLYGDFGNYDATSIEAQKIIAEMLDNDGLVGIVNTPLYSATRNRIRLCDAMRKLVDGTQVQMLVYGEKVRTRAVKHIGNVPQHSIKFLPEVTVLPENDGPGSG